MRDILVTLHTSHFEMSALKNFAFMKRSSIFTTRDTSQSFIGPDRASLQSPLEVLMKQIRTSMLSSSSFLGENTPATEQVAGHEHDMVLHGRWLGP